MAIKKLAKNTYRISEWGPFGPVKMYLLIGNERALLIDSGYGRIDLKNIISHITDKPVILMLTHGHLDHANGSAPFAAYLNENDFAVYTHHSNPDFLKPYLKGKRIEKAHLKPLLPSTVDLGGRKVEVILTPGHTRGSVCMLDKYSGMAFCGDTINPWDVWLGLDESLPVTEYKKSLVLLLQAVERNGITKLHSGHSQRAMNVQKLKNFITLCDQIISGEKTGRKVDKGICKGYKAKYKTAAIIWRER